jgi:uncharacterized protein
MDAHTSKDSLVTVSIRRRIKAGHEAEYEAGLARTLTDAVSQPTMHGATILAHGGTPPEYEILLHFDNEAAVAAWTSSHELRAWLDATDFLADGPPVIESYDAQNAWLIEPDTALAAPPRYKVAILTWIGIFPVITVLLAVFGSHLAGSPVVVRALVLTVLAIPLMTWVVMPLVTRAFVRWLRPTGARRREERRRTRTCT